MIRGTPYQKLNEHYFKARIMPFTNIDAKIETRRRNMKQTEEQNMKDLAALLATAGDNDPLMNLGKQIGAGALLKVLDTLGGDTGAASYIPSAECFIAAKRRENRNKDVCSQVKAGVDIEQMATKYGLQIKHIMQIVEAQAEPVTA